MGGFVDTLKKRVSKELKKTKPAVEYNSKNGNTSTITSILSPILKYKPFGGDTLKAGLEGVGYVANRADTALGTILRGSSKPGSWRYNLFTDTSRTSLPQVLDKATKSLRAAKAGEVATHLKIVPRASATTSMLVPVSLFTAGSAIATLSDTINKSKDSSIIPEATPRYNNEQPSIYVDNNITYIDPSQYQRY